MGFFSDWFGFQEKDNDDFVERQMCARSREEAINLTGDDSFYMGNDALDDDEDDIETELEMAGLDYDDLEMMDDDERLYWRLL